MGKTLEYTATVAFISARGSLGFIAQDTCILNGPRKMDGPGYLDKILRTTYEKAHPDIEVLDCRCNVFNILSTERHFHYTCGVMLRGKSKKTDEIAQLHDTVQVYVDKETIVPIED